jgi:hypothetical protein
VTLGPPDQLPELTGILVEGGMPDEAPPSVNAAPTSGSPAIAEAGPPASEITGGLVVPDVSVPSPWLGSQSQEGEAVSPEVGQPSPLYASPYTPEYVPVYVPYYQPVYQPVYYYPYDYYPSYTCYPWWGYGFGFGVAIIIDDHHHHDHDHDHDHGHDGGHHPASHPPIAHGPGTRPPPVNNSTRVVQMSPTKALPALVTSTPAKSGGSRPVAVRSNPQMPRVGSQRVGSQYVKPTVTGKAPTVQSPGVVVHAPRTENTPSFNVSGSNAARAANLHQPASHQPTVNHSGQAAVPSRSNVPSKSPTVIVPERAGSSGSGRVVHVEPPAIHSPRVYSPPVQAHVFEPRMDSPRVAGPERMAPMPSSPHVEAPRAAGPSPHVSAPAPHVAGPTPQTSNNLGKGSFGSAR